MQVYADGKYMSTAEVAEKAGIHKDTLLRWLKKGVIPEPIRDRNGWRSFSETEMNNIIEFAQKTTVGQEFNVAETLYSGNIKKLEKIDWDFSGAKTNYLTHGIHPYPAKFIPQIPNALIQELSSVGDIVGDIFCGSGTTLVEALTLKRHAVGVDANPLACLITRSKTCMINETDFIQLSELSKKAKALADSIVSYGENSLFPAQTFRSNGWRPDVQNQEFWFDNQVIEELAEALSFCNMLETQKSRELALTAFSSIIVTVSKQDSDTRYVRREKNIQPGDTLRRFGKAVEQISRAALEFSEIAESRFSCNITSASLLSEPQVPMMDLMVCSPPYPNAYSYHLYHRTRMVWLGMDQPKFKTDEIGSHRKYSSNSPKCATVDTFKSEFLIIMNWLSRNLKRGGYACFVVGNSTLKGQKIDNADIISETGCLAGFREVARIERSIQLTKKAFNPSHGKINTERILILENIA